jgi:hypothetical protein
MKNERETSRKIEEELADLEDDLSGCTDTGIATAISRRMEELRQQLRNQERERNVAP